MTLLLAKINDMADSITSDQHNGFIIVALIAVMLSFCNALQHKYFSMNNVLVPPFADESPETITVELCGTERDGIYCLPSGATVRVLLDVAGLDFSWMKEYERGRLLEHGVRLSIKDNNFYKGLIDPIKRFALHVPVNLNIASAEDLVCIPGIGIKTAEAIIETRNRIGGFCSIDDVSQISGVQEARIKRIKAFCYVP